MAKLIVVLSIIGALIIAVLLLLTGKNLFVIIRTGRGRSRECARILVLLMSLCGLLWIYIYLVEWGGEYQLIKTRDNVGAFSQRVSQSLTIDTDTAGFHLRGEMLSAELETFGGDIEWWQMVFSACPPGARKDSFQTALDDASLDYINAFLQLELARKRVDMSTPPMHGPESILYGWYRRCLTLTALSRNPKSIVNRVHVDEIGVLLYGGYSGHTSVFTDKPSRILQAVYGRLMAKMQLEPSPTCYYNNTLQPYHVDAQTRLALLDNLYNNYLITADVYQTIHKTISES